MLDKDNTRSLTSPHKETESPSSPPIPHTSTHKITSTKQSSTHPPTLPYLSIPLPTETHHLPPPPYMAAQHTTHRRMLAPPQPQPQPQPPPHPSQPMDPTLKRHQSKQNPHHKITPPTQKQPPNNTIDTLLQAKSMTASADFNAKSRHRLLHNLHNLKPRLLVEKQEAAAADGSNNEKKKVKKSTKSVAYSKVQEMAVGAAEKKSKIKEDCDSKGMIKELNQLMLEGFDIKKMSISLDGGGGGGGRRRSFSGTQVELRDFLAGNGAKVVSVDMPSFMQIHAVDCARKTCDSLEKFASKSLALTLKKEFDGVYGPAWHCIVGTSFGSFVTHSVGGFMYFALDQKLYILLFKTTVQKAAD